MGGYVSSSRLLAGGRAYHKLTVEDQAVFDQVLKGLGGAATPLDQ